MKFLIVLILCLALPFTPAGVGHGDDLLSGRTVYMRNCAACHGEFGRGDGPRATILEAKPKNLADPQVMASLNPEDIERAVIRGTPGIKEHSFGHLLRQEDVQNVIMYVRSLAR